MDNGKLFKICIYIYININKYIYIYMYGYMCLNTCAKHPWGIGNMSSSVLVRLRLRLSGHSNPSGSDAMTLMQGFQKVDPSETQTLD